MDAVFKHSASTGSARLVLLALADCAADTGEITAYARSHSTLMQKANVSKASVRRAVDVLVELGELEVLAVGDGRTKSDYRIVLDVLTNEGVQDDAPHVDAPGGSPRIPREVNVTPQGVQDDAPITPSLSVDHSSSSVRAPSLVVTFAEFWNEYPRKVSRRAAEQAWPRAVKRAGGRHGQIIDGARRYAADPNREDGFTAHPATWLNGDRWLDDPLPPRATSKVDRNLSALRRTAERVSNPLDAIGPGR